MTTSRGPIIVFGIAFLYPMAGVTWQVLHYLVGLRRLGWDPYYVEDSSRWVYDPAAGDFTPDPAGNVAAVVPALEEHGFGDRWACRARALDGRCYGLGEARLRALYAEAAAMLNVTAAQEIHDEHRAIRHRLYVETDPVATQIAVSEGDAKTVAELSAHDRLFTFGENLGAPDCGVPVERFAWQPTRQPVVLDFWRSAAAPPPDAPYTTIATWRHQKDRVYRGETYYWSKEREFLKILDLPRRCPAPIELSLDIAPEAGEAGPLLTASGWRLAPATAISRDIHRYRAYVGASRGEFTVAKDQNIRLRSGWFSDRSACYLASGRPVITQDTGFGNILPTGRGLFAWQSAEDIVAAMETIAADYPGHCRAAREIATEYFDAERVLASLLGRAGL
ncbi:MAG TPA: hypothetical protein VHT71_06185 [Methylomirabilota bacterium]|nr:hypothetical protein [Methylomirabilota bacterium]